MGEAARPLIQADPGTCEIQLRRDHTTGYRLEIGGVLCCNEMAGTLEEFERLENEENPGCSAVWIDPDTLRVYRDEEPIFNCPGCGARITVERR